MLKLIIVEVLVGIIIFGLVILIYGLIVGCVRYWTRQPYDEDLSFKYYFFDGVKSIFSFLFSKLILVGIVIIGCVLLDALFL